MALTSFQRHVCRLLAEQRKASGESYIAGGLALNAVLSGHRGSRDIDIFHDTAQALQASWARDRATLTREGLAVRVLREVPSFVEAVVSHGEDSVALQWTHDSAFRFFPLVEHEELGLTLHPFDLATNKLLALVGRDEPRDWIDTVHCHDHLQPLGYLAWAAAGKDPGFGPLAVVEQAARASRYTQADVDQLAFDGPAPDAGDLSRRWHAATAQAREIIARLPPERAGACVLTADGALATAAPTALERELTAGLVQFREGSIRGAFPRVLRQGGIAPDR